MKYLVIIRKTKYGYDTHVPALPGCHSQGDTQKEALKNIQDAILTYLEMKKEELKGACVREVEVVFNLANARSKLSRKKVLFEILD